MASYTITSATNSFTITVDGNSIRYPKNSFTTQKDPLDSQQLSIQKNGVVVYSIDLNRDNVDVNGTTTWADADALDLALEGVFFLKASGGGGGTAPIPRARIVLAAGGSNMQGVQNTSGLVGNLSKYNGYQENVFVWNGAAFENLIVGENSNFPDKLDVFGAHIAAAIDLAEATNDRVYIVVYAVQDSRLADRGDDNTWDINSSIGYYPKFKANFQSAFSWLQGQGFAPYYSAFLWDQGESDSGVGSEATAYQANLTALVSQVRIDTGVSDLFTIIALQYFSFTTFPATLQVREGKLNFIKLDGGNSVAFDTDNIPQSGDNITRSKEGEMLEGRVLESHIIKKYLTYDEFGGDAAGGFTIDTSKWNVTATPQVTVEQNNSLSFVPSGTQNQISGISNSAIDIASATTSGTLSVQAFVDWENPSLSGEKNAGFGIYVDANNYAIIGTTPTPGAQLALGNYRILVVENGLAKFNINTSIQKGKLCYVTFNSVGKDVTFEYWNEANQQRELIGSFGTNLTATTANIQGFAYCNDHSTRPGATRFFINEYYSYNSAQTSYTPTFASSLANVPIGNVVESFDVAGMEGNSNLNDGQFFGFLRALPSGLYNSITFLPKNLNLLPSQTFQLRGAIYDSNFKKVVSGSLLLDQTYNGAATITITLDNEFRVDDPAFYYWVFGVNDNVGGGVVSGARSSANALNNPDVSFNITVATGELPDDISGLTRSSTNIIYYQVLSTI